MSGPIPIIPFLSSEGVFVFTLTSNGYKYLTLNLLHSLQRAKVPWRLCVICADKPSYTFLVGQGFRENCISYAAAFPDLGPMIVPFGTRNFQLLNRKKLELLSQFTATDSIKLGIYLDGDIVVYSDFVPTIAAAFAKEGEDMRIYMQCDEKTRVDCSGNTHSGACSFGCSGFLAWRHGLPHYLFQVKGEAAVALWRECPEDQVFVNKMLQRLGLPWKTLPRHLFPNGMFVTQLGAEKERQDVAHLLHYNYLVGQMKQKKMAANGNWFLPY